MEEQKQHHGSDKKEGKNIALAFVAYILFFVPLLTDHKDDPFVKYHVKQGLVFFLAAFICQIIGIIPVIGWIIIFPLDIILLVIWIIGIIRVLNGEEKELPLIGGYAKHFTF